MADEAIRKAMDPSSDFPQPSLRSPKEKERVQDWQGPAGGGRGMKLSYSDPVQDRQGGGADRTAGVNRDVGQHMGQASHRQGGQHMAASEGCDKMQAGTGM